tara:strand:+ start:2291 stop:2449 length:159 start_codon:yes stop_codon:yes gene_type:complete
VLSAISHGWKSRARGMERKKREKKRVGRNPFGTVILHMSFLAVAGAGSELDG